MLYKIKMCLGTAEKKFECELLNFNEQNRFQKLLLISRRTT